jgi:hypothetical protein
MYTHAACPHVVSSYTRAHCLGPAAGLVPNTQYLSIAYEGGTCGPDATGSVLVNRFTANANGIANFTQQVPKDLSVIRSVSIQLVSDNSVQACGAVTQ